LRQPNAGGPGGHHLQIASRFVGTKSDRTPTLQPFAYVVAVQAVHLLKVAALQHRRHRIRINALCHTVNDERHEVQERVHLAQRPLTQPVAPKAPPAEQRVGRPPLVKSTANRAMTSTPKTPVRPARKTKEQEESKLRAAAIAHAAGLLQKHQDTKT